MIGVLIAWHSIVIALLIVLGAYWMIIFPLVIGVVLMGYGISARQVDSWKSEGQFLLRQFLLLGARSLIVVGLWSFSDVLGNQHYRSIGLVGFQIVGWIVSTLVGFDDGKKLFHWGYYLASVLLLISIGSVTDMMVFGELLASRGWLTIGLYAFLYYVIGGLGYTPGGRVGGLLYGYILAECIYLVMVKAGPYRMIGVLIFMLLLLLVAWQTHLLQEDSQLPIPVHDDEEDEFMALLYGEKRDTQFQMSNNKSIMDIGGLRNIILKNTTLIASSIAVVMSILMIGSILRVHSSIGGHELLGLYAILFTYCGGWLITRQRSEVWNRGRRISLIGVLVILYMSVMVWFGGSILYVAFAGVFVSLVLGIFLLYESYVLEIPLFGKEDRRVRLRGMIGITIINSIVCMQLPFSVQLIFAMLCIYLGIQGVLTRYVIQAIAE